MKTEWEKLCEKFLFDFGKHVLGKNAGGMINKLMLCKGIGSAWDSIKMAAEKSDPKEYLGAILKEIELPRSYHKTLPPDPPRPPRTPEQQAAIDAKIAQLREQFHIPPEGLPPKRMQPRPMRPLGRIQAATLMADLVARKSRHEA